MAAEKARAQAMQEYIAELEALIAKWQGATDPESRWVLRLLAQALNDAHSEFYQKPEWLTSMLH